MTQSRALAGSAVALTGRLASMTRPEATRRLREAGARVVREPDFDTRLLVVGRGGPALDEAGRPTRSLLRARELQRAGSSIEVVAEEELLALLGIEGFDRARGYTIEQLCRILSVPRREVRAWVRLGLVHPTQVRNRLALFDFQQVASARALVQLTRAGVGLAELRASLEQLAGQFERPEHALLQLEVLAGGGVAVRQADGGLREPSGQLRLDFEGLGAEPADPAPAGRLVAGPAPVDPLERGLDAEAEGRLADAAAIYSAAHEAGDDRAELSFNLANVLFVLGEPARAAELLLAAVERDKTFVEAWNNLGIVLDSLGRRREAVLAYSQALAVDPDYADAHFNLGDTFSALGDAVGAARHWTRYLAVDPLGPTADAVRARIAELGRG